MVVVMVVMVVMTVMVVTVSLSIQSSRNRRG